ncbi:hypothetical protein ACFQ0X_44030 [Streptomyces rectiviolaceus]|uniref:Integrase n=1 Tax=Streptomyces rectiviolaceus TaxID=332591 RepID=A0ABP6NP45_9ACTN
MAVAFHTPMPTRIRDGVTFKEASVLLRRTGHPRSKGTLQRWAQEEGITTERVAGTDYVSFTAILKLHAVRVRGDDN